MYPDIPLAAVGDGGGEKENREVQEWHVNRKAVQCSKWRGLFCCRVGLFLIECDLISNTEFPSSPVSAAAPHCSAEIRGGIALQ